MVYVCLQITLVAAWAVSSRGRTAASIPSGVLSFVSGLMLCILIELENTRSMRPGSLLVLWLSLTAVFDAVQVRSLWLIGDVAPVATTLSSSLVIKVCILTLHINRPQSTLLEPWRDYPPEARAGIHSRFSFWWLWPLLWNGYWNVLQLQDLWPVDPALSSGHLAEPLESRWSRRQYKEQPGPNSGQNHQSYRLLTTTFSAYAWSILAPVPGRLALVGFTYAQPFLLHRSTEYIKQTPGLSNRSQGYGLIAATAIIYIGISVMPSKSFRTKSCRKYEADLSPSCRQVTITINFTELLQV